MIPEGWTERLLGDLASLSAGPAKKSDGSRYVIVDMGSVAKDGSLLSHKMTDDGEDMLQVGDLVMPKDDIGGGQIIGKAVHIDVPNRYVLGDHVYRLRLSEGHPPYVRYAINSHSVNSSLRSKVVGSAQLGLGRSSVLEQPILFPPLAEQQAIAEAISDADALVESLDALIAKKRDMKQAAMQQLLTGRTRLPGLSEEWQQLSFGRVLQRLRGPGRALPAGEYTSTGSLPIIDQSQAAIAGWTDRVDLVVHCPESGVIVFGDHTRVVKFVGSDFVVGADGTQVLIPVGGGDARFLTNVLQRAEIPNTGYNRHFKFLTDLTLPCPSGVEQRRIAEVLSDMDAEIDALVAQREKAELVKQGMMQELLSGRVRLA